jgi:hypothetical protein
MLEILTTLKETPLPLVLVIGGLIFLLIPFIQKIQAKEVGVEIRNHLGAGIIGFVLLVTGIGLYTLPSGATPPTLPTELPQSATSTIIIPQESSSSTPEVVLPQPTVTVLQPVFTPTAIPPTFAPDPSCMTVTPFRELGSNGETKTYIRCPVGQVQYSIQVDDILDSIILSCPNQPNQNITFSKNEARSKNELLNTFDSEVFRSEAGCKVKITITNNFAEMGYTVWQEVIAP